MNFLYTHLVNLILHINDLAKVENAVKNIWEMKIVFI